MFPIVNGPAQNLDELYRTLRPEPLIDPAEFALFYRQQVNKVRGEDTVARLSKKLEQSYRTLPFKAFLMGHPGVGKSTEVSRLLTQVSQQQIGVRLSIATELNPACFKVFDVLVLMLIRLTEEAKNKATLLDSMLPATLVTEVTQWFGTEVVKNTSLDAVSTSVEAGAGIKDNSLWAGLLGIFASVKGEIKYAADRKTETIEYRLHRLPALVDICNRLIEVCSRILWEKEKKEWILIVEDLDKTGISPDQLQELFIHYGTVFQDLRVSMIFTIPVWLAYSPEAGRLPFERHMIHDTPVYGQSHQSHQPGREAMQAILDARVSAKLFAEGQMTRLITASGGNIRDLFALVLDAGEGALLSESGTGVITETDADAAINKMRRDYRMRLGQNPYDSKPISYADKLAKLLAVYSSSDDNEIPDPALYSLLRGRAIQEFNGRGWFGVHPLVVDILKDQGHLKPQDPGGTS